MLRKTLLAAATLLTLGACAAQETQTASAPPTGSDCFRNSDVFGYSIIDDHSVSVTTGGARAYVLTTRWNARELDWSNSIALRSPMNWVCTGNGLGVEVVGGDPPRAYPITSITRAPENPAPTGS